METFNIICRENRNSAESGQTHRTIFNVLLTVHHAMILGNCPT